MDNWENCSGYKILTQKTELDKKFMDERFDALKKHSDKRDDIIETKLDEINDNYKEINNFLQNGFTDKVLRTIELCFNKLITKIVKIILSAIVVALIGVAVKVIFF